MAPITISAVLPAPTSWASSTAGSCDDPGDRGDLVRAGLEAQRQAGQRQLRVVVAAQHEVVELLVVGRGQLRGAGRVLPGPFGEPLGQLGGLLLRGEVSRPG